MPIDPNIALSVQAPQIPNIGQSMLQGQQLALQRQQMLSLQTEREATAADTQARTAALARQNQAQSDLADAIQRTGGVREATLNYLTQFRPTAVPAATKYFNDADESAAKISQLKADVATKQGALNNAYLDHLGRMADQALSFAGNDPTLLSGAITTMAAHYGDQFPDEAARAKAGIQPLLQLPPDQQRQALLSMRSNAPYYQQQQAELQKPVTLGPGAVQVAGGQVTAQNPQMATGDAALDMRYQALRQKQMTGGQLTAGEQAEIASYRERKLLGPEAAAAAAANRQTATILAQMAQQGRSQVFSEAQAGRAELSNKVEQPFLDSREKIDTLKGVIAQAKAGNQMAGSVQPLMGVLGLVTAEGVKRINSTELAQVEGAGSLFERVKGEVGGWTAGQPLSPKIQQDLSDLADMLGQSATKKYLQGFTAVKTRYHLNDEQPLVSVAPQAGSSTAPAAAAIESPEHRVWRLTGKSGAEPK